MSDDALLTDTPVQIDDTEGLAVPEQHNSELSSSSPRMPLLKAVSTVNQIYTWQPSGNRITLKLPIVSDDKSPLFRLRNTPIFLTPTQCLAWLKHPPSMYRNLYPFKIAPVFNNDAEYVGVPDDSAVLVSQHSPPPLITYIALAHRFWRGGLSHMFRCTSQFTNQAQVFLTRIMASQERFFPFCGQEWPESSGNKMNAFSYDNATPATSRYLDTLQSNSHINADLSVTRHIEATVPFECPLPRHDVHADFVAIDRCSTRAVAPTPVSMSEASSNYSQWLAFGLKAGIDKGSGPGEIFFEHYIKAEADFEVSGYRTYPGYVTEAEQPTFLTDYNMDIGKNPIIFPNSLVTNTDTAFALSTPSK